LGECPVCPATKPTGPSSLLTSNTTTANDLSRLGTPSQANTPAATHQTTTTTSANGGGNNINMWQSYSTLGGYMGSDRYRANNTTTTSQVHGGGNYSSQQQQEPFPPAAHGSRAVSTSQPMEVARCRVCWQVGHDAPSCRLQQPRPPNCTICRRLGHVYALCPSVKCYLCKRNGHIAVMCPDDGSNLVSQSRCFKCFQGCYLVSPSRDPFQNELMRDTVGHKAIYCPQQQP
jgi:ribosomal protein L36